MWLKLVVGRTLIKCNDLFFWGTPGNIYSNLSYPFLSWHAYFQVVSAEGDGKLTEGKERSRVS